MQVRLRFTAITSIKSDILLVDEGIGAADSDFNARAATRLQEFYAGSGTLVLSSHAEEVLATHCAEAIRLDQGRVETSTP
jgi:ABC-type polysaccharide/polyol phosphate transport system ATPase subunit